MHKRTAILFGVIACLVIAGGVIYTAFINVRKATCPRCNIIIIVVDSLRADALPCYGYHLNTAPNICSFANSGTVFTNMYANSTWTRPSNMSILTGLYPPSHGITDPVNAQLNRRITTLPQLLYARGYNTFLVTNAHTNMMVELGFGRGFKNLELTQASINDQTLTTWLKTIDDIKESNKKHKPAFVYFHTDQVHDYQLDMLDVPSTFPLDPAYKPQKKYSFRPEFSKQLQKYIINFLTGTIQSTLIQSEIDYLDSIRSRVRQAPTLKESKKIFETLPPDLQKDVLFEFTVDNLIQKDFANYAVLNRHLYDERIRKFDLTIKQVLDRISSNGLMSNTVIAIVSDHGQLLGERNKFGHILGIDLEELHIPFILYVPGIAPQKISVLSQHIDMYPTVTELVGIKPPDSVSGMSLRDSITGQQNGMHNQFVISHTTLPYPSYSIRTDTHRLVEITYPNGLYRELYDLTQDPKEKKSIAPTDQLTVETLSSLLHTTLDKLPVYEPTSLLLPEWDSPEERRRALKNGAFFK